MNRTSVSQFETMVDFMERNGDLNKPTDGPHGRITAINKWGKLAAALNADVTGSRRNVEKWKRVWSDLKNNTKRKSSKIHRSANGTGGGPACRLVLTDLEQRVLNIIGVQAVTGLAIQEVGDIELANQMEADPPQPPTEEHLSPLLPQTSAHFHPVVESVNPPCATTPFVEVTEENVSPTVEQSVTPTRPRRLHRPTRTPRRRSSGVHNRADAILRELAQSNLQWQNLIREFVTENLRLRERELQLQAQWQVLFTRYLEHLER